MSNIPDGFGTKGLNFVDEQDISTTDGVADQGVVFVTVIVLAFMSIIAMLIFVFARREYRSEFFSRVRVPGGVYIARDPTGQ